jgi:glucose-6-phosphate 1-dehydrogenase
MVSRVIPVETFDLVIFGGTGDLALRKTLPGLYRRFPQNHLHDSWLDCLCWDAELEA